MKVLHLIKGLGRGGAEMLLPETLKHHAKQDFEFHYIYFLPWKNQLAEQLSKLGGKVECVPASNNLALLMSYRKVIKYVFDHEIELLHCHLPWAGLVGRIVHRLIGIPTVYTEHNEQERYHWLTRFLNVRTYNLQNAVIAVSAAVASSIRRNIGPRIPVHEISNGVDTSSFRPDPEAGEQARRALQLPPDAILVGTVAVFRIQKRLPEWLEVFAEAAEKEPRLRGVIVGDGPERDAVFKRRAELGLDDRVALPGLTTEVKQWLAAFDIYMMTSQFEGLPLALLEAMSMGCAVCTTDAGGIKEAVQHGSNGLLVPVDGWRNLSDSISQLAADEALRRKLALSARATVESTFSMRRMVEELEALYRGLNSRGKALRYSRS